MECGKNPGEERSRMGTGRALTWSITSRVDGK